MVSGIPSFIRTKADIQRYVNQNNFLRNIKNFKIDLRLTDPKAYICGIHWQVAQGTSLENIEFYMRYNGDTPGNTQQVCCPALMPYASEPLLTGL